MKNFAIAVQNAQIRAVLEQANLLQRARRIYSTPEELAQEHWAHTDIDMLFFPHWSHIVSDEILESVECVCFHATPLPFGRGGSPIQNMIKRGFKETELCALRMTREIDAGPVYARMPVSLEGRAIDIFDRLYQASAQMMEKMITTPGLPLEQSGEVTWFNRLGIEDNRLPEAGTLDALFDHIRMTDSPLYPYAWLNHGEWTLEFRNARLGTDHVTAEVVFSRKLGESPQSE